MAPSDAGRKPEPKHAALDRSLRKDIVKGKYQPGDRLPKWDDLTQRFNVSRLTIMKAVKSLREDGLITSTRKRGMFVADHPPHLYQYAVVFTLPIHGDGWASFLEGIYQNAQQPREDHIRFRFYEGINWEPNERQLARLEADIAMHRIAGIIAVSHSVHVLENRGVLKKLKQPYIYLSMADHLPEEKKHPTLFPDVASFRKKALDRAREEGRKRIGIILPGSEPDGELIQRWKADIQDHGMEVQAHWIQSVNWREGNWARHITALMMNLPAAKRPDCLIITDDVLVEPAVAGIHETSVKVGKDISVISHRNYPNPAPLPDERVIHLGFNTPQILDTSVANLQKMRANRPIDRSIKFPALFEHELPTG